MYVHPYRNPCTPEARYCNHKQYNGKQKTNCHREIRIDNQQFREEGEQNK